jgi:hypothetical protein
MHQTIQCPGSLVSPAGTAPGPGPRHSHAARPVRDAGVPPRRYGVAGNERPARAEGEADVEGALEDGAGVDLPHGAPRLLHRHPLPRRPALRLHHVHGVEVAVAVLVLDQHGQVVRVGARLHREGHVDARPLALHPAQYRAWRLYNSRNTWHQCRKISFEEALSMHSWLHAHNIPGILDLDGAGATQLALLPRLRQGTEGCPAHVEVDLLIGTRAIGALVGDDDSHRVTGASVIACAHSLMNNQAYRCQKAGVHE